MRDSDLQRLSEVVRPVVVEWRKLVPKAEQLAPLRCIECEGAPPMRKLQSKRDVRVVVDLCERCGGVWLDVNELRAIQQEPLMALLAGLVKVR
jgi:hypothetical protein